MHKTLWALVATLLLPCAAYSQNLGNPWKDEENGRAITRAALPACCDTVADSKACDKRAAFTVRDCASVADCTSSGTVTVRLQCTSTGWVAQNYVSVDLSAYAALAGAAFTGPITVISSGDSVDQFLVDLTDTTNNDSRVEIQGQASDDYAQFQVDATSNGIKTATFLMSDTGFSLNAFGADPEVVAIENAALLMGCAFYGSFSGPTALNVACGAPTECDMFYDNDADKQLCVCNGTAWTRTVDATTPCGDPI